MPTVTVIQPTIAEEKAVKIRCAADKVLQSGF